VFSRNALYKSTFYLLTYLLTYSYIMVQLLEAVALQVTLSTTCRPSQAHNTSSSAVAETAQCLLPLNISLSHSRSLKVIGMGTIQKLGYGFLFVAQRPHDASCH